MQFQLAATDALSALHQMVPLPPPFGCAFLPLADVHSKVTTGLLTLPGGPNLGNTPSLLS